MRNAMTVVARPSPSLGGIGPSRRSLLARPDRVYMSHEVIEDLVNGGELRSVNQRQLASAFMAMPGSATHSSSKAGLNQRSAVARNELQTDIITVSTIDPFVTTTELVESMRGTRGPGCRIGLAPDTPHRATRRRFRSSA